MTFLKIAFVVLLFVIFFVSYHLSSNSPVTTDEIIRQDESAQFTRSVDQFIKNIEKDKTTYVARGAHSKGHACVKAYFEINETIPFNLQHGVFSFPGRKYKSWIRFSNSKEGMKENYDTLKDAHGMAIKLFDIYDDTLINSGDSPEIQDFLMVDSPVFFAANIEDYNEFVETDDRILYFITGKNPFKWHLRELLLALNMLKEPPVSPLWTQYFSNAAYKLGSHNIKFSAQSCTSAEIDPGQDKTDPDFLRKTMAKELKSGEGCFNFMVQLQDPDKYMPIEDPSIEWKVSDSPYITIAHIRIPIQEFDTVAQRTFCENLSFSPWNALSEHRPIGQLNRIRKEVYAASSKYRHENNQTEIPASLDW